MMEEMIKQKISIGKVECPFFFLRLHKIKKKRVVTEKLWDEKKES